MQRLEFKADGLTPEQLRLPEQQSRFAKGLLIGAAAVLAVIYSGSRGGVAISPLALAFDSRLVGDATPVQSVLLRNTSRGPLRVNSVKVKGASSGDFLVARHNCAGAFIESGNACMIEIRFLPQASGDRTAVLVLADDAPDSPQTVRLNGSATERRDLAVIPGILSFDAREVGSNSTLSVQVVNKGSAAVSIASPTFSGDAQGDFEIASETCTVGALSRGQSCNMAVRFKPTTEGGGPQRCGSRTGAAMNPIWCF